MRKQLEGSNVSSEKLKQEMIDKSREIEQLAMNNKRLTKETANKEMQIKETKKIGKEAARLLDEVILELERQKNLNSVLEASMKKLDTLFNEKKRENEEFQQKIQQQEEELKELIEGQVETNEAIDNFVDTQTELTRLREEISKNNEIILDLESQIRILEQNKQIADAILGAEGQILQATVAQRNQLARSKIGSISKLNN